MAFDYEGLNWKTVRGAKIARFLPGQSKSLDVSGALGVPVGRGTIIGMIFPADLNSAAKVFFEVSIDDQVYVPLADVDGDRIEVVVTASSAVPVQAADFFPWDFIRVQTVNSGGAAVVQASTSKDIVLIVAVV